jgi:integrase
VSAPGACRAGHQAGPRSSRGACSRCRRDAIVAQVAAADRSLAPGQVAAAVDAAAGTGQALRSLAAALAGRTARDVLADGAPPGVGRLVAELISRGSAEFTAAACKSCGTTGRQLTRSSWGGVCPRCRNRLLAAACACCGGVKPVAGRTGAGEPVCERCRRHERGHRPCGTCGKTAPIAVRARGGRADVCVNCYQMPQAVCTVCGRRRPCNFAGGGNPVCKTCTPRAASRCARCGLDRPAAARWPEGPVCDTCYTSALRRRGACTACGQQRRLVAPPGPSAIMCADCAGLPLTHLCALCGVEDKLFEKGRCARCSLHSRAWDLLAGTETIPGLTVVVQAIAAARNPYSALNWLRTGSAAVILAEIAAGRTALTHQALDVHPNWRAADYLRHILAAGGVLPARDEALARIELWSREVLNTIDEPADRRLVQAYLTWQVLRRLRRRSETAARPRIVTGGARHQVRAVVAYLAWLRRNGLTLASCGQGDVETWLATGPAAYDVRDFLAWAAARKHCLTLQIPGPQRKAGTATDPGQRWELVHRLLHDATLDLTDRAAGCLLLLFGQHLSRIAAMTTDQIITRDGPVLVRFGQHEVPVPDSLARILTDLIAAGRSHTGTGSPIISPWLFPGGMPGQPITPSRLGERLRALGIRAMPGRRAALIDLAAQLPAAILADSLNLSPGTAVRWMHQAGADWNRYAADIARSRDHQP